VSLHTVLRHTDEVITELAVLQTVCHTCAMRNLSGCDTGAKFRSVYSYFSYSSNIHEAKMIQIYALVYGMYSAICITTYVLLLKLYFQKGDKSTSVYA